MALKMDELSKSSVKIVNLTKKYGSFCAVNDVSFNVESGELLVMVGPSGSGKTTILNTIAGFITPTDGDVILGTQSIKNLPPYKRELGMVFQNYGLFPHMTVFDNVAFPLKMRQVPSIQIEKMVNETLDLVRLRGFSTRKPFQLSGGQQQRVALARAIVYQPPVLLMDEPLGALDKKLRDQVQIEIKHLQKRLGITMIYVTHDQSEALTLADRIVVLHQGELQQIGSPEDVYEHPVNSFVADFVGEMNFINGFIHFSDHQMGYISCENDLSVYIPITESTKRDFKEGMSVILAIRPERIVLRSITDNGFDGLNGLIEEVIYLGETITYLIQITPTNKITCRNQSDNQSKKWKVGDNVKIHWNPQDIILYRGLD